MEGYVFNELLIIVTEKNEEKELESEHTTTGFSD